MFGMWGCAAGRQSVHVHDVGGDGEGSAFLWERFRCSIALLAWGDLGAQTAPMHAASRCDWFTRCLCFSTYMHDTLSHIMNK